MIEPIQIIFILFALFALSRAWLRYREGKIRSGEFVFWLVLWIAAIVAFIQPVTVSVISNLLGIGRPADLIIYAAIILLFYMIFRMYVAVEEVNHKITEVVREVAIAKVKKK